MILFALSAIPKVYGYSSYDVIIYSSSPLFSALSLSRLVSLLPPISMTMLLVVILVKVAPDLNEKDKSDGIGFL